TCIPPRFYTVVRVADPHLANAKAGNERDLAVDDEDLSVISRYPAQGPREIKRVVTSDLNAVVAKSVPKPSRSIPESAKPIVDEPDLDPFLCLFDNGIGKQAALPVFMNDVRLEM